MAKTKTKIEVTDELESEVTETKIEVKNKAKSIIVMYEGGSGQRIYSADVHGDDFMLLAEEFVAKSPTTRKIV